MNKKTQAWIFNIVMLVVFILIVFVPIYDGKTLFKVGMDKVMGVEVSEQSSKKD